MILREPWIPVTHQQDKEHDEANSGRRLGKSAKHSQKNTFKKALMSTSRISGPCEVVLGRTKLEKHSPSGNVYQLVV